VLKRRGMPIPSKSLKLTILTDGTLPWVEEVEEVEEVDGA